MITELVGTANEPIEVALAGLASASQLLHVLKDCERRPALFQESHRRPRGVTSPCRLARGLLDCAVKILATIAVQGRYGIALHPSNEGVARQIADIIAIDVLDRVPLEEMDVWKDVMRSEESIVPLLLKLHIFTRECVCNLWHGARAAFPQIMKGLESKIHDVRTAASRCPPPLASCQLGQFFQPSREAKQLLRTKLRELSCEDALQAAL